MMTDELPQIDDHFDIKTHNGIITVVAPSFVCGNNRGQVSSVEINLADRLAVEDHEHSVIRYWAVIEGSPTAVPRLLLVAGGGTP